MSNDINRDFIIQHLYDIMTINLHIKNLEENINSLNSKKNDLEKSIDEEMRELYCPFEPQEQKTEIEHIIPLPLILFLCVIFWPVGLILLAIRIIERLAYANEDDKRNELNRDKYLKELDEYNKKTEEFEIKSKGVKEIAIPNLDKAIADLEKERNEGYKLLNEICDLNIIPSKYRTLCAVTFLYDFISTSKLSLENAILSCDLDKIQSQFDTVIMQNMNKICLLTKINAKNGKMLEQNEEMLTKLNNIKRNTTGINTSLESIKQSNEIIAKNTKVIAYCEAVNYINNNDIGLFDPYSPETISDFGLSHFRGNYK